MTRKNEAEVLAYVNELRKKFDIGEPLKEMPPDLTYEQWKRAGESLAISCPVAQALGRPCGVETVNLGRGYTELPEYVADFIRDHDDRFRSKYRYWLF